MSSPHRVRKARRALGAELDPTERRRWFSHGVAALAISALGLVVASSMALTTNAEVTGGQPVVTVQLAPVSGTAATSTEVTTATTAENPSLTAFARREAAVPTRSATVRAAIVKERAAQRSESLARTAEVISRTIRDKASDKRVADLAEADRRVRENAVQLAWQRQQQAIADRVAAEQASNQTTTDPNATNGPVTDPDLSSLPTGGGSASPVPGAVIGARFGQYGLWSRYHTGIDFRAGYGTPIRAVKAGIVLYSGNKGDWAGNHVAIRHAGGVTTMSSHMSAMAVHAGQTVQAGQVIGYVGETGRAFGAHLHFELYPAGAKYGDVYKAINPQPWLLANGIQTH